MARYEPFIPAKREEVPDYARAAFLQAQAENDRFANEQAQYENKVSGYGSLYRGVADSMPEGKNPLSEALRLGKAGVSKMKGMAGGGGGVPMPEPKPGGGMGPGPGPVNSALPGTGRANGGSLSKALREQPPMRSSQQPPRQSAPAPQPEPMPMPQQKPMDTGLDLNKAMSNPTPVPIPQQLPGGKNDGFNIPTGPGPQTSNVPPASELGGSNAAGGVISGLQTAANVAQQPTTQGKVKAGVGGIGMTGLTTAGPALAAAGPVGWAGLAGLAAMSLYGMLG
jgi:hypothetical protein